VVAVRRGSKGRVERVFSSLFSAKRVAGANSCASTQTWVFHEKPFDKMFGIELIAQMDPSFKVLEARADRYQRAAEGQSNPSGPGTLSGSSERENAADCGDSRTPTGCYETSADGCDAVVALCAKSSSCDSYHDPPGGYLLTARRDNRSNRFRIERYIKGIAQDAALRKSGRFNDPISCALVSLVVAAAAGGRGEAKNLTGALFSSGDCKKHWKKGWRMAKELFSRWFNDGTTLPVAIQALQRLFVESSRAGDDLRFREEYETYEVVKDEVEKIFCKVLSPVHYIRLVRSGPNLSYQHVSFQNIGAVLDNKFFFKYVASEWDDMERAIAWQPAKAKFFPVWREDEHLQVANVLTFDPSSPPGCDSMEGTFNMWAGFDAQRMPQVPDEDAQPLFGMYVQHCIDVLGREEADFLMDYFAHIIQRPHVKTGVAVLIAGPHGGGKGTIADIFRAVVGATHSFRVGAKDAKERLFGRFSDGLKMKVIVQVDEAPDLTRINNSLKDVITADTWQFEDKGLQPYTLPNHANLVFTTNDDAPVRIEDGDRRWVAFTCSRVHKDDHGYFKRLRNSLDYNTGIRSVYQGLLSRDISHIYNMQKSRVVTPYYRRCRSLFLPPLVKFFSALYRQAVGARRAFGPPAESNNKTNCSASGDLPPPGVREESDGKDLKASHGAEGLRAKFTRFLEATGLDDPREWNQTRFGNAMSEHVEHFRKRSGEAFNPDAPDSGIHKTCDVAGNIYEIDFAKLKKYLDRKSWFDEDAEIPDNGLPIPGTIGRHATPENSPEVLAKRVRQ